MKTSETLEFREEYDSIGSHQVPQTAYYGVQSIRAKENFPITGQLLDPIFIHSLAYIKKASAMTNGKLGLLDDKVAKAIITACEEILAGQLHQDFIVDPIQGGAGTSMNMNINEVVANRASELLGEDKGKYNLVHPNDHVNYGQSTNDVIPTAGKLTIYQLTQGLLEEMERLEKTLTDKSIEFNDVIKMGRTQMQDAIPIRLGQEFKAYASAVTRSHQRLTQVIDEMLVVNMGATAIGTGLNADVEYVNQIVPTLANITGLELKQSEDLVDGTQHIDSFAAVSGVLRTFALSLSKIANDLRLMSSGPKTGFNEINLPKKQNGSSIMPGKVNPVIPEVVSQVAYRVVGNDTTIAMSVEAGQLELNAFEPVIFYSLFESIKILQNGIATFIDNCIAGITANPERCQELVDQSVGTITALVPHIGYQKAAEIAKRALNNNERVKDIILSEKLLDEEELESILAPEKMTSPGICHK
ncbi:aspartate ammonia-lyase [Facklamia miroungae]|uniref:aspartate ammonia-lyase n=1 Tax=Facklamia miroungae TaxID=120956 RepID=A0A1G7T5P1_9LACT|nr:aspartate ammonia-lyase [Facklamia miroungae]NKZ29676.1 aspartate ammonia-lyase [Facklamia miroungae]SDG30687.1 aspartate ammonia-lyase [Facklamia miroungae]